MSTTASVPPYLFSQEGTFDAPFTFEVPASLEVQPYTAHATFDGSGASGDFRPCLTFYSASGVVLGRYFPAEVLHSGDVAEVTYTPPFGTAPVSPSPAGGATVDFGVILEMIHSGPLDFARVSQLGYLATIDPIPVGSEVFLTTAWTMPIGGPVTVTGVNPQATPLDFQIIEAMVQQVGATSRESLAGNAVTIPGGGSANLTWDFTFGPNSLLDITTPDTPTIKAAGTYIVSVTVNVS